MVVVAGFLYLLLDLLFFCFVAVMRFSEMHSESNLSCVNSKTV